MTIQQTSGAPRTIIQIVIVTLILALLAGIIYFVTISRFVSEERASSLESCAGLKKEEVDRSERLLRASLSGTITVAVADLEDVQAERSLKDAARSLKKVQLMTNQIALEKSDDRRTTKQKELAAQEADLKEAQSDLADKNELRAAEESNMAQEEIDVLTSDIADLESKIARHGVIVSTRNEQIAALSEEIGSLTEAIATLNGEIGALDEQIASLARREAALESTIEAKYLARSALLSSDGRVHEIGQVDIEIKQLRKDLDDWKKELLGIEESETGASRGDAIIAHIEILELRRATLIGPVWALDAEARDGISGAYLPPRSDVNLVTAVPVSHIDLGSHREISKVEVILTSASIGVPEESSAVAEDGAATIAPSGELPDKVQYFTEAGLFRRSEGGTVPADQIFVWSRRVGTTVIMSVCIEPDGLDPGLYAGEVYLVDPSLSPMRIGIELTAQSRWINWLYSLLIILPALALAYVWITARYSAGQDPWERSHWWTWFRQNAVAVLVVGFAAVWATLQVPFNNPTWGTSWLTAAAVIGVGLVAAVTAMTVVAGRVVAEGKSDDPPGGEVETESGKATQEDV
jgi:predicted  nucleic acid-binding Zn-ribbon protein